MKLLTTKEAAETLGVSYVRINQFIKEGRLPAQKMGRDYVIAEEDLKLLKGRKVGRPSKPDEELKQPRRKRTSVSTKPGAKSKK
jgi:excisionase family DNA binding protein